MGIRKLGVFSQAATDDEAMVHTMVKGPTVVKVLTVVKGPSVVKVLTAVKVQGSLVVRILAMEVLIKLGTMCKILSILTRGQFSLQSRMSHHLRTDKVKTVTTPRDISFIIKVILTVKVTHHTAKVTHPKDRDIHLTVKTTVKGTHLRAQGIHLKDQDIRDMAKDTHHRATLVKDLQARFHRIINFCYIICKAVRVVASFSLGRIIKKFCLFVLSDVRYTFSCL
nr:uncharacterized protein LOC116776819 isoform X1 [Danaus plexippus plexippus]